MEFSGHGDNIVFRSNKGSADPYYCISAQLDLTGKSASNAVYYFNMDNNYDYVVNNNYNGFYKIDSHSVISEVVSFSSDIAYEGGSGESRISSGNLIAVARNGSSVATLFLNASPSSFNVFAGDYIVVSGISNDSNSFNTAVPTMVTSASAAVSKASGAQIVNVSRNGSNVATITLSGTAASFGLATGDVVSVSGITNDSGNFNTSIPVSITVSGNTFTYSNTGALFGSAAATGALKDVSYPANIKYSDPGAVVSVVAAAGASRNVSTPILLLVGGAYKPSSNSQSIDIWGGPSGNLSAPISLAQMNVSQSCHYGSEPAYPASDPMLGSRKFLAVKVIGGNNSNMLSSGIVSVVVKVYSKFG